VFNYRGVGVSNVVEEPSEDNLYAIVDLVDYETINQSNAPGLASTTVLGTELVTLRAGLKAGATGSVTVNISTCRATGHDFLDIGTGGFNSSNYPNVIFGEPGEKKEANEVIEKGKGRVFYVSSDQNGIFRVGRFFSVDQGTGTVSFSASLALSDVDGLGFKRGVVITEFSTDTAMVDNASDTVPTENATRIYIERRLGVTHDGGSVIESQLLPTPNGGFMALSGQLPMKGQIDMNDYTIVNLTDPANPQDAVNLRSLTLDNFQDYAGSNVQAGQFLVLTGDGNTLTNVSITGDVVTTQAGSNLNVQIVNNVIVDSDVNTTANILQSKLLMSLATATAAAPGGTTAAKQALSGLTSFNSADFTVIDGWVTLKSNSVATSDLAQLSK